MIFIICMSKRRNTLKLHNVKVKGYFKISFSISIVRKLQLILRQPILKEDKKKQAKNARQNLF